MLSSNLIICIGSLAIFALFIAISQCFILSALHRIERKQKEDEIKEYKKTLNKQVKNH